MYLAIDPGVSTGWALLRQDGLLVAAGHGQTFGAEGVTAAMIELPQVYLPGKSKGDPNKLITLAVRVGRYQERLERCGVPVSLVRPASWKGQIKKPVHHRRIEVLYLNEGERRMLEAKGFPRPKSEKCKAADVWDAVALGKWWFTERRFAISRSES